MTETKYQIYEDYMQSIMRDSAHDQEHIYRVLRAARMIAACEERVDMDILIVSCLLHDIGRPEEFRDPRICHAGAGGEKAYRFLLEHGWDEERAGRVRECIIRHRYRSDNPPDSIEAKILFDADKLDATGAIGIARTLIYDGIVSEPIYTLKTDGTVSGGEGDEHPSFFQEYKNKLETLYDKFYTVKGQELAQARRAAAEAFYRSLLTEVEMLYYNQV